MAAMTIRNIPDDVHRALKSRARRNGRSAEAEVRALLEESVRRDGDAGFGTWLVGLGPGLWDVDLDSPVVDDATRPVDLA